LVHDFTDDIRERFVTRFFYCLRWDIRSSCYRFPNDFWEWRRPRFLESVFHGIAENIRKCLDWSDFFRFFRLISGQGVRNRTWRRFQ
jgi:hypothetical protein